MKIRNIQHCHTKISISHRQRGMA